MCSWFQAESGVLDDASMVIRSAPGSYCLLDPSGEYHMGKTSEHENSFGSLFLSFSFLITGSQVVGVALAWGWPYTSMCSDKCYYHFSCFSQSVSHRGNWSWQKSKPKHGPCFQGIFSDVHIHAINPSYPTFLEKGEGQHAYKLLRQYRIQAGAHGLADMVTLPS